MLRLLAAALCLTLLAACGRQPEAATSTPGGLFGGGLKTGPQVGQAAPDFILTDEAGETVSLSGLRGTPVLLNFWATWCEPCRKEMPELQKLQDSLPGKLHVIAVDVGENKTQAAAFKQELGLTFTTPIDPTRQATAKYNLFGLPASYVIDKDGVIRAVKFGPYTDEKDLRKSIASVGLP